MYQIDKSTNTVRKLDERLFSELHIKERENLQEWIANNPEMLGEELLIIQKEFAGFNDTNERLDLLAVDKNGSLVIIENKLDDTGRDVVWQSLKYTSYCSTLTTKQIIKIYQEYLDKWAANENAEENLLDFLEREEEDLLLNKDDQRIILVANNYRKEVTSTVLWLLNHNVQIQCFRASPYSMGQELFLQVEQIIPLPETKEFMIDAIQKEKEEKSKSRTVTESETRLVKFWGALKKELEAKNLEYLDRVSAKPHYSIGFWKGNARFAFCLGRKNNRVELYIAHDADKLFFDELYKFNDQLEAKHPNMNFEWERLDNKKASRLKVEWPDEEYQKVAGPFDDENSWQPRIDWFVGAMEQFYKAVYPFWAKVDKH